MKAILGRLVSLYLVVAVTGRLLEALGYAQCECPPECWCQRPVLSTFRWVLPYGHVDVPRGQTGSR